MSTGCGSNKGRWRSTLIVGLLLAAMVLVAVLTGQAQYAARSHRETAESVLRDYSRLVADEFIRRVSAEVGYYGYYPLITTLKRSSGANGSGSLPTPEELSTSMEEQVRPAITLARTFFLVDLTGASGGLPVIKTAGEDLEPVTQVWLLAKLTSLESQAGGSEAPFAVLHGEIDGEPHSFVHAFLPGTRVIGFLVDTKALIPWFQRAVNHGSLLPASLGEGELGNDLLYLSLHDSRGREVFHIGTYYEPALSVETPFSTAYNGVLDGMNVLTSINPAATPRLVIGGLPRSRVPVILGLLLLTTALLMLAIYVLRREHALARLRSDFIARVSHELRTPLTQIRMFTETLLLGRVRSRQEEQRSLEIMDREVRRLSHLVENILQFSRGERGAIRLAPQSTELGPLVEELVERFRPLALRRDVQVTTQLQGKVTATVDTEAMCQIILNLLDNALNYGPAGQEIRVGLTGTDTTARITIEDQGPGIPRKERQKIWDRFNRLERDERAAIAGTGIGLTVVRELVGLQGGRVWVDSRHGEGARFVVEMPRQRPLLPAREKARVGVPGTLEPAPGRTDSTG